jgi:tRNA pseudouridine55 synthase
MSFTGDDFLNGQVLLIDKPLTWTSFDVVNYLRSLIRKVYGLKKLKVGHAGTLDPLATGLLIICTGKKTKEIDAYQGMDKVYVGSLTLGSSTPSYDKETEPDHFFDISNITENDLIRATKTFIGKIEQIPPLYSAVKIEGKRAFDYARKNKEVTLKSREVIIHDFSLLNIVLPNIDFTVNCSKGTYIRSLVHDYGTILNNGAHLTALHRTQIGEFKVANAYSVEAFKKLIIDHPSD